MQRRIKRVVSLLLMVCLLLTTVQTPIIADVGSGTVDGSKGDKDTGATYDESSRSAEFVTDTNEGNTSQRAGKENWALRGPMTYTRYDMHINGQVLGALARYSDVDWTKGVGRYRNETEDIDRFIELASAKTGMTVEEIRETGFEIHAYVEMNARRPYGAYGRWEIKTHKDTLTKSPHYVAKTSSYRTFIAKAVLAAASNLGDDDDGYAYYIVPPEVLEDTPKEIRTFVKAVGYDEDGNYIIEEYKEPEVITYHEGSSRFDKNTGIVDLVPYYELDDGSTAYINDIITSPKDLESTSSIGEVEWLEAGPKTETEQVYLNRQRPIRLFFLPFFMH